MITFSMDGVYGTTRETLGLLGQQPDDRNAEQDRDLGIASELLAKHPIATLETLEVFKQFKWRVTLNGPEARLLEMSKLRPGS